MLPVLLTGARRTGARLTGARLTGARLAGAPPADAARDNLADSAEAAAIWRALFFTTAAADLAAALNSAFFSDT